MTTIYKNETWRTYEHYILTSCSSHRSMSFIGTIVSEEEASRIASCINSMPEILKALQDTSYIAKHYAPTGEELGGRFNRESIQKAQEILDKFVIT